MRCWNYIHAKTERARFWGGNPKQTGLQTNELRNEKTPDEAMLPTANKARNTAERAAVIRVVSKGRNGEDRKCRCSRRDQPGMTKEQKGQWTKAEETQQKGCIGCWRGYLTAQKQEGKIDIFLCSEGPGV